MLSTTIEPITTLAGANQASTWLSEQSLSRNIITKNSWENGWPKIALESLSDQQLTRLMDLLKKFKKILLEN